MALCLEDVREHDEQETYEKSVEAFMTTFKQNNWYLTKFLLCETVQLLTLVGVVQMTDVFLSGMFYSLGPSSVRYFLAHDDKRKSMINPMCQVFPTVTSCQFPTGSLTGTVNVDHALCVLSLNIVNDKIFLVEWFWFLILLIVALVNTVCRFLNLLLPCLQILALQSWDMGLYMENEKVMKRVVSRCRLGDWFLLTLVRKNLDTRQFSGWITVLDSHINTTRKEKMRRRDICNSHLLQTLPHWKKTTQGLRERKYFTLEKRNQRSDVGDKDTFDFVN